MSVLTRTDLWESARGNHFPFKAPSEYIWLEVLRRGILHRKHATIHWHCVRSLERTIERIFSGQIPDVNPETVNEAKRVKEIIASVPISRKLELDQLPIAACNLGTGASRKNEPASADSQNRLPASLPVRVLVDAPRGHMRIQDPKLQRTAGHDPHWYVRPYFRQKDGSRKQRRIRIGRCSEVTNSQAIVAKHRIMAEVNRRNAAGECDWSSRIWELHELISGGTQTMDDQGSRREQKKMLTRAVELIDAAGDRLLAEGRRTPDLTRILRAARNKVSAVLSEIGPSI